MKLTIWALVICAAIASTQARAWTSASSEQVVLVKELSSKAFLQKASPVKMKVWEPHENKEFIYEGYLLTDVLNFIYGIQWKKKDLILFVCADGYKATVPRSNFENIQSLLAFKKYDLAGNPLDFTLNNVDQHESNINLAPFYLVWDNENNAEIRAEGGTHWPYQVTDLELRNYQDLYQQAAPPASASINVHKGFALFEKYCISCHQIKGEGGDKGMELVTTQIINNLSVDWLKKWIDDPASLKSDTTMPPLNRNLKNRNQAIDNIISYLRAVSGIYPN